jgi:hypothetical protein
MIDLLIAEVVVVYPCRHHLDFQSIPDLRISLPQHWSIEEESSTTCPPEDGATRLTVCK